MPHPTLVLLVPLLALAGCSKTPREAAVPTAPPTPADPRLDAGHPVIVRVVGRANTLTVSSTPRGPVYSVTDPQGRTTLAQGSLDDLRRQHPDLYRHVQTGIASPARPSPQARDKADDEHPLDYLLIAQPSARR